MIVPSEWNGYGLFGKWTVSKKLDGVRALSDGQTVLSRKNKPLYGLDSIASKFRDAEIFCGSFDETITIVRSHDERPVRLDEVYHLDVLDERLFLQELHNPTADQINMLIKSVADPGRIDGIVLRQGDNWIKCKPIRTYDVTVIGIIPGKGKHTGRMGALKTVMGNVGTGFTDLDRVRLNNCIGKVIEVSCLELTKDKKFRHPRFIRLRPDKD